MMRTEGPEEQRRFEKFTEKRVDVTNRTARRLPFCSSAYNKDQSSISEWVLPVYNLACVFVHHLACRFMLKRIQTLNVQKRQRHSYNTHHQAVQSRSSSTKLLNLFAGEGALAIRRLCLVGLMCAGSFVILRWTYCNNT
ncbi:hypothetical protein COHA_004583 [Chlorella ohadii]|uniref:Uncharacterized protein n=1 Tax=Chlorella ohadii TaxID=2649997 RepID=A0AAD5H736_9CHLO|nr:hypothetical protein COHA_004583 [Chlorella ohadii]